MGKLPMSGTPVLRIAGRRTEGRRRILGGTPKPPIAAGTPKPRIMRGRAAPREAGGGGRC